MRTLLVVAVLAGILAGPVFYQGFIYSRFHELLAQTNVSAADYRFEEITKTIEDFKNQRWYWPIKKYPKIDFLEIDRQLAYQEANARIELGQFDVAYALLEKSARSETANLAGHSLYNQGNIRLYEGNIPLAEKRWQESLQKMGQDFDAHVNLELLQKNKAKAVAAATATSAILSYRRAKDYTPPLRSSAKRDGPIKP